MTPIKTHEQSLHSQNQGVVGNICSGIIGLLFFENDQGHNVTINSDCYVDMLNDFFRPRFDDLVSVRHDQKIFDDAK